MAVYTTRIEADRADVPVLLANGNLVETGKLPGEKHFAVWHDPHPKPSYLFALVGGNLGCVDDTFTTMSGRKVALKIYVERGKEDRCAYAMDSLKRSLRWDEDGLRPRIRPRHLHDRRRVRLQHGRDGEQGPQRLQRQICAREF
jgi:aminopeptidase N